MKNSRLMLGVAALLAAFSLSAHAKLYKWVDDQGVTHYGETIPPEYANRDAQQFDKGRVTTREEKKDSKSKSAVVEDKATREARRRDEALLSSYTSEREIDLARDRNLLQIEARVNSYSTILKAAQGSLNSLLQEKDGLTRQGRAIPASLTEDIARGEAQVAKVQGDLEKSRQEMETMKARYEADKQRFRELKNK